MYPIVLLLHSWNRWLVLGAAAFALPRAYRGWLTGKPFTTADDRAGGLLVGALDLQLLLGRWLYFDLSALVQAARPDWGAALRNPTLRFWSVEHLALMLTGIVVAYAGRALSKRAGRAAAQRHQLAALFFAVAIGLVLLGVPFALRPWFRF